MVERLSGFHLYGRLLALHINITQGWKSLVRYKRSNLVSLFVNDEEKSFIVLSPGLNVIKLLMAVIVI